MNGTYITHVMAIGPHPDDVEIGAGGLLLQSSGGGNRSIIVDLTPSQLSTRGTPEQRVIESYRAASLLGVERINLGLYDLQLCPDEKHIMLLARQIRYYRPEILVFPYHTDRHPDHEATSRIVKQAIFIAGLSKIVIDGLSVHRPRVAAMYHIWGHDDVDIVLALSEDEYKRKYEAFRSYHSQVDTNDWARHYFDGRSRVLGWNVGSAYGEGYVLYDSFVGVSSFDSLSTKPL